MDRFLSSATPQERDALLEVMNELQLQEMQSTFNTITSTCFNRCISNFRGRTLDNSEKSCLNNCAEKFVAHMARVGQRFAEETMPMQQAPSSSSPSSSASN